MPKKYSKELRAEVMGKLSTGQSIDKVAEEYNLPCGTVGRWSSEKTSVIHSTSDATQAEIGALLLGYVKQTVETLTTQAKVFGDEVWLKKQPAAELAVLHGVQADKAIRLIEAMAKVQGQE
jgi:hypothetical protein